MPCLGQVLKLLTLYRKFVSTVPTLTQPIGLQYKEFFDTSRGHPTVAHGTESMEAEMAILMPTGELVRIESQ